MYLLGIVILLVINGGVEMHGGVESAIKGSCQTTCLQYYPNLTFALAGAFNPTYGVHKKTNMPVATKATSRVGGTRSRINAYTGKGFKERRLRKDKIIKKTKFHIDEEYHIVCSGTFCIQFGKS